MGFGLGSQILRHSFAISVIPLISPDFSEQKLFTLYPHYGLPHDGGDRHRHHDGDGHGGGDGHHGGDDGRLRGGDGRLRGGDGRLRGGAYDDLQSKVDAAVFFYLAQGEGSET
ncbi:hypothetical protein PENANT_c008G06681 [Penicillium antarcticum]|uniref:Uncharacterized protein n=1 Tax=Penicillium antarcticum TaxID=416450 RepID=A0A1V6QB94_9EURO|nr:hypothetical protein PENANT_c008G06681 [Penicillium antarcticum]